jgi:hypothetical protein
MVESSWGDFGEIRVIFLYLKFRFFHFFVSVSVLIEPAYRGGAEESWQLGCGRSRPRSGEAK